MHARHRRSAHALVLLIIAHLAFFSSGFVFWGAFQTDPAPVAAGPTPSTEPPAEVEIASPTPAATPTPTPTATPLPQPTPDGVERVVRVPILMYHHIADPRPGAGAVERDLSVSPARFEEQLRYLREAGYQTITMNDLVCHLTMGSPLPEKPIILTFDDGYRDLYANAFPLLKAYGYTGTIYIITDFVDRGIERYLTWPQIEEMAAAGIEFGAHSRDHADLRGKPNDFLVWQILGSKQTLEAHLQAPVRAFSFPSGSYDENTITVLRSAQYWSAVTSKQGATHPASGLFTLSRIRVRGSDTLGKFTTKLDLEW